MCPQQEAFAHELHLRPIIASLPSAVGNLIHAGLAYRYAALMTTKPAWFVYANGYEAIDALATDQGRPDFGALAVRVFSAYEEHYKVNVWRPIVVEEQFVVHFDNGEPYSCRTDLLAEDAWGSVWVIDHKSCGKLSRNLNAKYCTDWQMLTNLALSRALGYKTRGVIINELSREETPKFQRQEIQINQIAYDGLGINTNYYLDRMKEVRQAFPDPLHRPRNVNACQGKFGTCDFYGLCFGGSTIDEFVIPEEVRNGRKLKGT